MLLLRTPSYQLAHDVHVDNTKAKHKFIEGFEAIAGKQLTGTELRRRSGQ